MILLLKFIKLCLKRFFVKNKYVSIVLILITFVITYWDLLIYINELVLTLVKFLFTFVTINYYLLTLILK